jgi:hypothetical protein
MSAFTGDRTEQVDYGNVSILWKELQSGYVVMWALFMIEVPFE